MWIYILALILAVVAILYKRYEKALGFIKIFVTYSKKYKQFIASGQTTADFWESRVKATPTKIALIFEENGITRTFSYAQLDREANKLAAWAWSEGLRPKQMVSLMMENRPEFIITWLGLCKIGVATSLINTNLRGTSLIHCLHLSESKYVIAGPECTHVIDELKSQLNTTHYWVYGSSTPISGWNDLSAHMKASKDCTISPSQRAGCNALDLLWYIFTSGTTGMPKAAKIKHTRFMGGGRIFPMMHNITCDDRIYCSLPLYHSSASVIGVGSSWHAGAALILRSKFSASNFWRDCYIHNATIIQYIGQTCRYLLNTPPGEYDTAHMVRKALGNGMQLETWEPFQQRFNVPEIGEFYASTEGNAAMLNYHYNMVGSVGYVPPLAESLYPLALAEFDYETEQPKRNANGFCARTKVGQAGELLGLVVESDPVKRFDGYTSEKANQDKLLRNVFKKGDCWFRTGDLLRKDAEGNYFFVDRIGDTFRWKGENVATSEVSALISEFPGFADINVYGVSVPHCEGRAGMASVTLHNETTLDWEALHKFLFANLTSYQIPYFLRIQPEQELTGTFKLKKGDLVKQGFNPNVIHDTLLFRDDTKKTFVPLTPELYQSIVDGKIRI